MTNWKEAYKDTWTISTAREERVREILQQRGFTVFPFGFYAFSTEYTEEHPSEAGKPDMLVLSNPPILVEVTGTNHLSPYADIWIREDKILYANNHPSCKVWLAHVIDDLDLIRFINLSAISPEEYSRINPTIRGNQEEYVAVPYDNLLSLAKFFYIHWGDE